MRRRLAFAILGLYAAFAFALPALHQAHHARFGADHVHTAGGTRYFAHDIAAHHSAFDVDLAALGLADAVHGGALAVDCSLAAYTFADCGDESSDHPHTFGDELLARTSHRPDVDPEHHRDAVEHGAAPLLAPGPMMVPPRPRVIGRIEIIAKPASRPSLFVLTRLCRGPPLPA